MEGLSMDWSLHNLQFEGMHIFGNKMYQLTMRGASTCDSNESSKLGFNVLINLRSLKSRDHMIFLHLDIVGI